LNTNPPSDGILVGFFQDVAWIRVRRRGCVQCSPELRAFIDHLIAIGRRRVIIDLEECPGMDSTFMGTLTGISLRLRKEPGGSLDILNPGSRNLESLRELGLDHVLSVDVDGRLWLRERALVPSLPCDAVPAGTATPGARRAVVQDAHRALCEANAENIPKFRSVLEVLAEAHPQ
jgi:anti-anti-sigma regulatory factor